MVLFNELKAKTLGAVRLAQGSVANEASTVVEYDSLLLYEGAFELRRCVRMSYSLLQTGNELERKGVTYCTGGHQWAQLP